jgi:hypothetical protein
MFKDFLKFMEEGSWKKIVNPQEIPAYFNYDLASSLFYVTKSKGRLDKIKTPLPHEVNGRECLISWDVVLQKMDKLDYNSICRFCQFHGDLQFDNIIHNDKGFTLIDWRDTFTDMQKAGDIHYDFAKLYAGLDINYDYIKKGLFSVNVLNGKAEISFARRSNYRQYEDILIDYIVDKGYNMQFVELVKWLIYMNMAPLHKQSFSDLLYYYSLWGINSPLVTRIFEINGMGKDGNSVFA